MKKFIFLLVIVIIFLSGCNSKNQPDPNGTPATTKTTSTGPCKEEKVDRQNYGDQAKRLTNCFVEYPGEPSREDKSYYIVEDICGQFTKEFIENLLGKTLVKTEPSTIAGLNSCSYYLDDKDNFLLNLEYLAIEKQKKGNELIGYRVEKNEQIFMDNLVVYQEDGTINTVYLVLNPNKFISIRPVSKKTFPDLTLLDFSAKLAGGD